MTHKCSLLRKKLLFKPMDLQHTLDQEEFEQVYVKEEKEDDIAVTIKSEEDENSPPSLQLNLNKEDTVEEQSSGSTGQDECSVPGTKNKSKLFLGETLNHILLRNTNDLLRILAFIFIFFGASVL